MMDHLSSTILMCAILVLFYASGTVKGGTAFGDTCTTAGDTSQCTDTNTVCKTGDGGLKCRCKTDYYKSTADCKAQVTIGGGCDKADTATDQCSVGNTACDSGTSTCLCTSNYYASSSTCHDRIALGETCSTSGASNQCADNNAECPSGAKCMCKSTHYKNGDACSARKNPTVGCTGDQCVASAACSSGNKCTCNTGYIATPTTNPTSCKSSDAATIMLAHMHVFIFGTVASLYFLV